MLIAVRGIGKVSVYIVCLAYALFTHVLFQWTVDMFAMFSLRRPDILAVGDLGLQRGLLQWVLSSHDPDKHPLRVSPKKLPKSNEDEGTEPTKTAETQVATEAGEPSSSVLPAPTTPRKRKASDVPLVDDTTPIAPAPAPLDTPPRTPPRKASTLGKKKAKIEKEDNSKVVSLIPTAAVPLPEGMTLETLRSRANGKKVKGGSYLLPTEMQAMTQAWAPYRSLGV